MSLLPVSCTAQLRRFPKSSIDRRESAGARALQASFSSGGRLRHHVPPFRMFAVLREHIGADGLNPESVGAGVGDHMADERRRRAGSAHARRRVRMVGADQRRAENGEGEFGFALDFRDPRNIAAGFSVCLFFDRDRVRHGVLIAPSGLSLNRRRRRASAPWSPASAPHLKHATMTVTRRAFSAVKIFLDKTNLRYILCASRHNVWTTME